MTQQSFLHWVVNWEVFSINTCCFIAKFLFHIILTCFGLLIEIGLRSGGQMYTTMQNFVKIGLCDITYFLFLPRDTMLIAVYAVVVCLCVCVCYTPVLYQHG